MVTMVVTVPEDGEYEFLQTNDIVVQNISNMPVRLSVGSSQPNSNTTNYHVLPPNHFIFIDGNPVDGSVYVSVGNSGRSALVAYSTESGMTPPWILEDGTWNANGIWTTDGLWNAGP